MELGTEESKLTRLQLKKEARQWKRSLNLAPNKAPCIRENKAPYGKSATQ